MEDETTPTRGPVDEVNPTRERRMRRIQLRVTPSLHEQLDYAAALAGQTLTEFITDAARRAAVEAVEQHQILKLNVEQSRMVAELLLNAPDPPAALVKTMREYQERVAGHRAASQPGDTVKTN